MALRITFFALMALGLLGLGAIAFVATHPARPTIAAVAPASGHRARPGGKPRDPRRQPHQARGPERRRRSRSRSARPSESLDTPAMRRALTGSMVRRSLTAGEPVRRDELLRPGDHGFLAAVLKPGMRAVTVGVDDITGTAGLIWPGDQVDLILTEKISNPAITQGQSIVAETVLSDVRVIAIDQRLIEGAAAGEPTRQAHTVTLEVTEAEAQKVQVAVRLGRLSLSVRSAQNVAGIAPGHQATWASDVSPALASVSHSPPGGVMNIWQGAANAQEFKF